MTSQEILFRSVKDAEFILDMIEDKILCDLSAAGLPQTIDEIVKVAAERFDEYVGIMIKEHMFSQKNYQKRF